MATTDEQFEARVVKVLQQEADNPEQWYYLSFAKTPEEGGFQGAVFLRAQGTATAHQTATLLGLNPHGEMLAIPIPSESEDMLPPEADRYRLLSKQDIQRLWPEAKSLGEWEEAKDAE